MISERGFISCISFDEYIQRDYVNFFLISCIFLLLFTVHIQHYIICAEIKWNWKIRANFSPLVLRYLIFVIGTLNWIMKLRAKVKEKSMRSSVLFQLLYYRKINNDNNRRQSFFSYNSAFSAFLLSGKSLFCYFPCKMYLSPQNKEEKNFPNYKMVSISFCMERKNQREKKSQANKQTTQWTKIKQDK